MVDIFADLPKGSKQNSQKRQKSHAICSLPVGKSGNISVILTHLSKTLVGSINFEVCICNIILFTNDFNFAASFKIMNPTRFFCQIPLMFLQDVMVNNL